MPKPVPSGSKLVPNGSKMDEFMCEICTRNFTRKGNLNKHLLSKHGIDNRSKSIKNPNSDFSKMPKKSIPRILAPQKNTQNPQKNTILLLSKSVTCNYCEKTLSRQDALSRHLKICKVKNDKLRRYDEMKKEFTEMEKEYTEIKSELKRKDDIIDTTTKANKYAMSTFSYLAKKFIDTPALSKTHGTQLDTIMYKDHNTDDDFELVECLIYYHRYKRLHEYIGDTIVSIYKKDDPEAQSIWNSDTQRLSYIIRTIVDNDIEWKRDNGGKKVLKVVINPILEYIEKKVKGYILHLPENLYHPKKFNEMILDAHKLSRELNDIKGLGKVILGYITPFFHFKMNNLIEL